jgi:predicted acyl esterase
VQIETTDVLAELSLKRCASCSQLLHFDAFWRNRTNRHGLEYSCKECVRAFRNTPERQAKLKAAARRWQIRNTDLCNERARQYAKGKKRRRTEAARARDQLPHNVIKGRIKRRMTRFFNSGKGGRSSRELLGYTMEELKAHLERQFVKGMDWDNRSRWHIDHIVPLAAFDISGWDDPEVKRAWALTNLRPIWAKQNLEKGARSQFLL